LIQYCIEWEAPVKVCVEEWEKNAIDSKKMTAAQKILYINIARKAWSLYAVEKEGSHSK